MNISKDVLIKLRKKLDSEYDKLEKEITKLYSLNKEDENLKKKIDVQVLLDQQISLIDNIVKDLDRVPRLYDELMKKNEQYNKIVGE